MLISVYDSNKGIKKSVNQDSLFIKKALTDKGEILFAGVCDGMGGLVHGELASNEVSKEMSLWFEEDLNDMSKNLIDDRRIVDSLNERILNVDFKIRRYGEEHGACGTTLSSSLFFNKKYLTTNVGDSRVYKISDGKINQLTHDHSLVQDLIDRGLITKEEANSHPKRSVLLQCIGTGEDAVADYGFGEYKDQDIFLICSDGFRHKISEEEFLKVFDTKKIKNQQDLDERVKYCVNLNMRRKEIDNISAIAIKFLEEL